MDDKTKAEDEALKQLFEQPGWQVLMRNTQARLDSFAEGFPFSVKNVEQLYFCQGMVAALKSLLTLEQQFAAQEEAASDEPDADSV
jgi:hypothetical protein